MTDAECFGDRKIEITEAGPGKCVSSAVAGGSFCGKRKGRWIQQLNTAGNGQIHPRICEVENIRPGVTDRKAIIRPGIGAVRQARTEREDYGYIPVAERWLPATVHGSG